VVRVVVSGESHGERLVTTVEGLPAGLDVELDVIRRELERRRTVPGRSERQTLEGDGIEVLAGLRGGRTIGGPVSLSLANASCPTWANDRVTRPRPGHAGLAGVVKYGFQDLRDVTERASARLTAGRVVGGALCRQVLEQVGMELFGFVRALGGLWDESTKQAPHVPRQLPVRGQTLGLDSQVDSSWLALIEEAREAGDSLGGVVEVWARGVPVGLGSYNADDLRLDARLGASLFSIPAVKAVEIGEGFGVAERRGSQGVDPIIATDKAGGVRRASNLAGGLEGGMSNGETIVLRCAVKPVPTTQAGVETVDLATGAIVAAPYERSDVSAVPAVAVIAENVLSVPLLQVLIEKFGGDTVDELTERILEYRELWDRGLPWLEP